MTSDIESTPPPLAPAEAGGKTGPLQRMIGALFSPDETFREIAERPDFMVPLLIIIVISTVSSFLVAPRLEFDSVRAQIASNPNIGPDGVDRAMKVTSVMSKVFTYAAPILVVAILAIVAGVLLIAFRLFGGEGTFKQAFSVVAYAWIPDVIYRMILTIVIVAKGSIDVGDIPTAVFSNGAFLVTMTDHPVLFSLLSSLDIFTVWVIVLLIIGFAYVSRMSKGRAASIVLSIWFFILIVKIGFAALGAARAAKAAT